MKRTYIKNVQLYDGHSLIHRGCVLIENGIIAHSGAPGEIDLAGAEVIDARGGLCLPGLNNAHTHAAMTLLRGVGSDLTLMDWLGKIWPIEDRLDGDAVYWGTTLAMMEMLRRGVTGFADMYMFMTDAARAVGDAGMRANLSRAVVHDDGARLRESIALYEDFHGAFDGRIKVYLSVHGEYTTNADQVRQVRDAAERLDTGVHIHLSETKAEVQGCLSRHGVSPVRFFKDLGLFDRPVLAAHCVAVDRADIDVLAEYGVWAVHNPASNLKLASGVAPVCDMLKAGVRVALGSDSVASNNQYDIFAEMRLAAMLQKGVTGDPTVITVAEALDMATRAGAQSMGFDDVGLIAPGMRADLILLDPDAENLCSAIDPMSNLVYSAQGLNVTLTMVDGEVLYRNGRFTHIDAERTLAMARSAQARLLGG